MSGINKVIIVGRLGTDPEVKELDSGTMTTFSVATSEKWTKDGETKEKTEWHKVTTFGKLAVLCGEYLRKGRQVYLEGKLQTRQYDKDGETRYTTGIIADKVEFLGSAQAADEVAETKTATPAAKPSAPKKTVEKQVKNYATGETKTVRTETDDFGF